MHSPDFVPRYVERLSYCGIGSGQGAVREIEETADWLFAGQPGNDMIERIALRDAVAEFIAAEGIVDVGGMFLCLKVDHRGVGFLGEATGLPGDQIFIRFDPAVGRWIQGNEKTGKVIEILPPWEIDPRKVKASILFEDWADAVRAFNPRHLQRRVP
jgi:hypothetical protein